MPGAGSRGVWGAGPVGAGLAAGCVEGVMPAPGDWPLLAALVGSLLAVSLLVRRGAFVVGAEADGCGVESGERVCGAVDGAVASITPAPRVGRGSCDVMVMGVSVVAADWVAVACCSVCCRVVLRRRPPRRPRRLPVRWPGA